VVLVAFELARRLSSSADKVAFVGLLATLPPGHHLLRLRTWTAYLYRQLIASSRSIRGPLLAPVVQSCECGAW